MHIVVTPTIVRTTIHAAWGNAKRARDAAKIELARAENEAEQARKKVVMLNEQTAELERWLVENPE